jgi:hypothetical protein
VTGPGASSSNPNLGCDAYESTFLTPDGYEADETGGDFRTGASVSVSLDTSGTAKDSRSEQGSGLGLD